MIFLHADNYIKYSIGTSKHIGSVYLVALPTYMKYHNTISITAWLALLERRHIMCARCLRAVLFCYDCSKSLMSWHAMNFSMHTCFLRRASGKHIRLVPHVRALAVGLTRLNRRARMIESEQSQTAKVGTKSAWKSVCKPSISSIGEHACNTWV